MKLDAISRTKHAVFLFAALISSESFAAVKIQKIEFLGKSSPQQIRVIADGAMQIEKTENTGDQQIVLEIKDAKLANRNVGRAIDTSSFKGNVILVSPYESKDGQSVRVIVQLRKAVEANLEANGKQALLAIGGPADLAMISEAEAAAGQAPVDNPEAAKDSSANEASQASAGNSSDSLATQASDAETSTPEIPNEPPKDALAQVEASIKDKKYVGRRITVNFKDADVVDVFRLIGDTSGFNMVIGSEVTGRVNLSLTDVPWDQVLDIVLTTLRLGAERNGNILRIATLQTLTQEKTQQLQAKTAAQASAPRVTRIFPISYAEPARLVPVLQRFGAGAAGSGDASATRDTILVDDRTNSIIIQDIQDNLDRMAKIIELLDRPTPQVQIESKIVEASENFQKSMSGQLGFGSVADNNRLYGYGIARDGSFQDPLLSNPVSANSAATANPTNPANTLGLGMRLGRFMNVRLNSILSMNEVEGKLKVISSPRVVVLNKQAANIVQGQPVLVPTSVTNATTGAVGIGQTVASANLRLGVTPTVTNDGNIIMDLQVQSDVPKQLDATNSGIANRSINTRVVTESGGTLVIGGVYSNSESTGESGFPFLRKLPLIGILFGSESKTIDRNELFIFITPRVINEEREGA